MPRPRSPGCTFRARSIHRFIGRNLFRCFSSHLVSYCVAALVAGHIGYGGQVCQGFRRHCSICRGTISRRRSPAIRRRSAGVHEHYLLIHILGDEFCAAADFQSRGPTPGIVAAEHAGIDQEHFVVKAGPDAPSLLHRVADHNVGRLVSTQDLVYLRAALFVSPLSRSRETRTGHRDAW